MPFYPLTGLQTYTNCTCIGKWIFMYCTYMYMYHCIAVSEKGFCILGESCPYDHGRDPVVIGGGIHPYTPPPPLPPPLGMPLPIVKPSECSNQHQSCLYVHVHVCTRVVVIVTYIYIYTCTYVHIFMCVHGPLATSFILRLFSQWLWDKVNA